MELPVNLIEVYRAALVAGAGLASQAEQPLYALHSRELEQLTQLLATDAPASEILQLLSTERRSFGWSFLSGGHGARFEQAFFALSSALEAAPNNSIKPKPLLGSA